MILADTGPLVALCDRYDASHRDCRRRLGLIAERLVTTLPVLTEAFHLLAPEGRGADDLRAFILKGGAAIHNPDEAEITRAFELMETYGDQKMDFADASVIAAAETLRTRKIFTLDGRDFTVYRIRRGHRLYPPEIV